MLDFMELRGTFVYYSASLVTAVSLKENITSLNNEILQYFESSGPYKNFLNLFWRHLIKHML